VAAAHDDDIDDVRHKSLAGADGMVSMIALSSTRLDGPDFQAKCSEAHATDGHAGAVISKSLTGVDLSNGSPPLHSGRTDQNRTSRAQFVTPHTLAQGLHLPRHISADRSAWLRTFVGQGRMSDRSGRMPDRKHI
jgi:hypothetical protein